MSLSPADIAAIVVAVRAAEAADKAADKAARAKARVTEPTHEWGKNRSCAASPACSRTDLRTAKRAASHGIEAGGHTAR